MTFFANFADFLGELCGQKLFTAESAENDRGGREENSSLAAAAWVCPKAGAVGNYDFHIIGRAGNLEVAMFQRLTVSPAQRLLDRRFRQRGHDLVSRGVGVEAVIG
jgi:hypothetical protein